MTGHNNRRLFMNRKSLTFAVGALAVGVTLSACGSSGSSGGNNAPAAGGSSSSATVASKLILGGPPEFKTRPDGVPGLQKLYNVTFGGYKALDAGGPLTVNALKNGQVGAADLFTTDPSIQANGFVILDDPKSDFAAQNILPLINKAKATDGVKQVLNGVSSKLDTQTVGQLLSKVVSDKQDPDKVAKDWLASSGLAAGSASGVSLTIGSANFQENVMLADIYAEALKKAGATVKTKLNIGSREAYIPGLKDGSIDLIPEYTGVLLQYFDKTATATSADDVYAALQKAVPAPLIVLDKSAAEDKDAIVVTKETAAKYNLKSIADLANNG
jgi:osmoprotectant transport system substrate-binding protein